MRFIALCTACYVLLTTLAFGQWSSNTSINAPIRTAPGSQRSPVILSDGASGAIISWHEDVDGQAGSIRCQHVNADGYALWSADGVVLRQMSSSSVIPISAPLMTTDGSDGAIIVWLEFQGNNNRILHAQRVSADGTVLWTTDGVIVTTSTQLLSDIVADGAGGAIVAWTTEGDGYRDLVAQHLGADGAMQWISSGITICHSTGSLLNSSMISDETGGAIAVWEDKRLDDTSDIYVQRIDGSGIIRWATNDVAVCARRAYRDAPTMISDGERGAIVSWREGSNSIMDIYAQRVNAVGSINWNANGVPICTATGMQDLPKLAGDGAGGAFLAWHDKRDAANLDVYAQRVNTSGETQWATDGVPICSTEGPQGNVIITRDANGAAIIAWWDYRKGDNRGDLYAQRLDMNGASQWTANGVAIATPTTDVTSPRIISDGSGGAILVWEHASGDFSNATHHVYTQKVCANGVIGDCIATNIDITESDENQPDIWTDGIQIHVRLHPGTEALFSTNAQTISLSDMLGRSLCVVNIDNSNTQTLDVTGLPDGLYLVSVQSSSTSYSRSVLVTR